MKRFYLLLILAVIVLSGCDIPKDTPSKEKTTKIETPLSIEDEAQTSTVQETPTAESVSKKIEEVESSLRETQDLLVKRTAEQDAYKTEFLQLIRGKGKAPEEIERECMKKTSELDQFSWFSKAKTAWGNWKDVAKDVVIFTRQNARLEKSLQELKLLESKLKRIEENRKVYRPGEDAELDSLIAGTEVHLEFEDYNNLSSADQALIDEEVHKSMNETIKKTVSKIPNLELKSIEELPALPDFAALIDQPTDEVQQSMFMTVRNKCEERKLTISLRINSRN